MSVVSARLQFVGRDPEIAALAEHLAGGRPSPVVVVAGPAGIGKTTLVDEALRRAGGGSAVRGHGPAEPAPPLWPWRAALRRAGIDLARSPDTRRPDVEPAAASSARFAALARMSDALLAAAPLTVVLEDLHWADAASLDLLAQLAAAGSESGLTVVGTVRSPAPEPIAVRLAGLARYGVAAVTLAPFTTAEVADVVGADTAADVARRTGGLPLLVAAVRNGHSADISTPDIAVVVRALLAALTADQRTVIEAAAVLGEDVDEALLTAVTAPDELVGDALTAAWHGGILAAEAGRYRFAHALVRDGIVALLDPPTARRLHRAAALALESSADTDRAARIATHWRQVGADPDARRAAVYWSRAAAAAARSVLAHTDVVRLLDEALADVADNDAVTRAEVLLGLADAEFLLGHYDRCLARCADAAQAAAGVDRGDLVARAALVLQGVTYPQAGHIVTRLCERALAYPDLPLGLRARLLAQRAVMIADAGRVPEAAALAQESLELATASADPHAEIEAARAREVTLTHADDTAERLRLGELVADRAEALGQPLAALIGHQWRIQAAYLAGRLDVVDASATAVEQLADRSGLPLGRWHHYRLLASRTALVGRFAESTDWSRQATALVAASGDQTAISMHFAHAFWLAVVRGTTKDLPEGYARALAAAPSMPLIDVERAMVLSVTGRVDEARTVYDGVRRLLPLPAEHPAWVAVLIKLTWLIARFEDQEAADITYRQLLPFRPYPGALGTCTVYFGGTISRQLAELAAVSGDHPGAEELFREALVRNQSLGAAPDTALTRFGLARVLQRTGSRPAFDEAVAHARAALSIATDLDMPGTVADARSLLTVLTTDRAKADPLTAREREIAVLLAGALSNRQIAERLVLSERTVETHVRNILAKTGCANRTEFVARGAA